MLYSDKIKRPRLHEDFPDEYYSRRDYTTNRIIDILSGKSLLEDDLFKKRTLDELYKFIGHDLGTLYNEWRNWRKELYDIGRSE